MASQVLAVVMSTSVLDSLPTFANSLAMSRECRAVVSCFCLKRFKCF